MAARLQFKMLGWWFTVRLHTETEWSTLPDRDKYQLASWETGVSGIRWIEKLVTNGEAEKLSGNAYPNRHQLRAAHVLKTLQDHMQVATTGNTPTADWHNARFVADVINTCPPDAMLVVEAWDQS
jgi:hypothetical protein